MVKLNQGPQWHYRQKSCWTTPSGALTRTRKGEIRKGLPAGMRNDFTPLRFNAGLPRLQRHGCISMIHSPYLPIDLFTAAFITKRSSPPPAALWRRDAAQKGPNGPSCCLKKTSFLCVHICTFINKCRPFKSSCSQKSGVAAEDRH